MQMDYNAIESITQIPICFLTETEIDRDELIIINEIIKKQYIEFTNLGKDLLNNIDNKYKIIIFQEMIEYIVNNYSAIINYDESRVSPEKTLEVGNFLYGFYTIDFPNIILPNFLSENSLISFRSFEEYTNNLDGDYSLLKAQLIKTVQGILSNLSKLTNIDTNIKLDKSYQYLIKKFGFYLELVNFGFTQSLYQNYIYPAFLKNEQEILWRLL